MPLRTTSSAALTMPTGTPSAVPVAACASSSKSCEGRPGSTTGSPDGELAVVDGGLAGVDRMRADLLADLSLASPREHHARSTGRSPPAVADAAQGDGHLRAVTRPDAPALGT